MYVRFIAPVKPGGYTVTRSHVAPGLFGPACDLWWTREEMTPALLGIRRELDWFNANLPVPKRFGVKAKGRWWSDGVCWFRDSAGEMLGHAYALAALIEECGVRIDRLRSRDPGQILYRDDWQVVAMPERHRVIRSIPPPAGLLLFIWRWACRGILESLVGLKRRRSRPLTWLSSLTRPEGRIAAGGRAPLRAFGPFHRHPESSFP